LSTGGPETIDTSSAAVGLEGPFFGDLGDVIRVRRAKMEIQRDLPRNYVLLFFAMVIILVFIDVAFMGSEFWPLFMIFVLLVVFSVIIWNHEPRTARLLEISRDGAVMSHDDGPPDTIASIRFSERTVVNVVLNEACDSGEFGHLYGWTIKDGPTEMRVSAHEGWELWDVQTLRGPIYRLMEHHGMERGPELAYYQDGMGGVIPRRRRRYTVPSSEPPTL
jgi:hypothetical protein